VVDEDVDGTEALDGGGGGARDRLAVADVGHDRQRLTAVRLDLGRGAPGAVLVDLDDRDPRSEGREAESDTLADAGPRAGHDRGAVGEERSPGVHVYLGV